MKKALLIVDVQNDFLPGGALPVKDGDQIIPVINQLQEQFDLVIATKDWHPLHHNSFAVEHGKEPGEIIEYRDLKQELWPVHCVQESPGAEFSTQLETAKIAKVFHKGIDPEIDSYSSFYDNAHLRSTGLADYLKEHHIEELYIVGLATDYCVKFSVFDARELGFLVTVVLSGCRGIDLKPGDVDKAIEEMKAAGAKIVQS